MSLAKSLPKAELHLHLEGSVELSTLREFDGGISSDLYRFSDFGGFLQAFKTVHLCLRDPLHYGAIAGRLLARLADDNVRYVELTVSMGVVLWKQQDPEAVFQAVREAAARQQSVEVRWIFDAVRHFGIDHVAQVAELAIRHRAHGVVAFGVGGDEERGPCRDFRSVFENVREHGLAVVPHAGETTSAAEVWSAVEAGAQRIGHGIRAVDDPVLVRHLRDHLIPLEICLSSNVATGAVPSLESHPFRRLYDAGVPIVLNTDDPAMFGTTLSREYEIASNAYGLGDEDLRRLADNSFRFAIGPFRH